MYELNIDTIEVENEISAYIRTVILSVDEEIIFNLLRQQEYIEVEIPDIETQSVKIKSFIAKVPRDIIEHILFDV